MTYAEVTTKVMSLCKYVGNKLDVGEDERHPDKKGWCFHFDNFIVVVYRDVEDNGKVYYFSEIVDNIYPLAKNIKFSLDDGKPQVTIGTPAIAKYHPEKGLFANLCKALEGCICLAG